MPSRNLHWRRLRRLATMGLLAAALGMFDLPAGLAAPGSRPNFVVILGEGAGWASTSVPMDDRVSASRGAGLRTPNLERLAAAGLRFSDGYAASPRCTPSRAALFTGRSPAALGMTFIGEGRGRAGAEVATRVLAPPALLELPEAETTLGELLQRAGYATAHFGKWHAGRVPPSRHGFDESDGPNGNGGPENVANPNPKQARALTAKGIDFMERQAKAGRPFYLQLSHYPSQEEKGGGGGGNRAAAPHLEEIAIVDETLGQTLDAMERLGLRDRTCVVYTTDHGSPGRNPPLAGGKGTVGEGGLRVPFIVAGPGIPAGACCHVRVSALDLFPTLAELAGATATLPPGLEGGSLVQVLRTGGNGTVRRARDEFVVHFPHYDKDPLGPASALYLGEFKLIRVYETGKRLLFDLSRDLGERNDLALSRPEKAAELDRRLDDYLRAVNAQMPSLIPRFDPSQAADTLPGERRKGRGQRRGSGETARPIP